MSLADPTKTLTNCNYIPLEVGPEVAIAQVVGTELKTMEDKLMTQKSLKEANQSLTDRKAAIIAHLEGTRASDDMVLSHALLGVTDAADALPKFREMLDDIISYVQDTRLTDVLGMVDEFRASFNVSFSERLSSGKCLRVRVMEDMDGTVWVVLSCGPSVYL